MLERRVGLGGNSSFVGARELFVLVDEEGFVGLSDELGALG